MTITASLGIALLVCIAGNCTPVRDAIYYWCEYVRDESNSELKHKALPFINRLLSWLRGSVLKCRHASAVRRTVRGAITVAVMKISRFAGLRQSEVSRRQKAWQLTHEQVNFEAVAQCRRQLLSGTAGLTKLFLQNIIAKIQAARTQGVADR